MQTNPISNSFALRLFKTNELEAGALRGFGGPNCEADDFDFVVARTEDNGDVRHDTIEQGERSGDRKAAFAEIENYAAMLAAE